MRLRILVMQLAVLAVVAPVLRAAALGEVLERAARAAQRESVDLSSLACTERVTAVRYDEKQKVQEKRQEVFDYLVMIDTSDGDLAVTESRLEQNPPKKEAQPLLASTGFATMMLILHPYYQESFHFTDLGTQEDAGRTWRKIGFEHRPGTRSPTVLRVSSREYPLSWRGDVLVDEATGMVGYVHAYLGERLEDIGLERLSADVRYGPAQLGQGARGWVPLEAVVELGTKHRGWRNTHMFSGYKRFEVTATEKRQGAGSH